MTKIDTSVVVIGGGIAGTSAASALAQLGIDSIVLEKNNVPGGHAALWACMATNECATCSACTVQDAVRGVRNASRASFVTGAKLEAVTKTGQGYVLNLIPTGEDGPRCDWRCTGPVSITARALVVATGFTPFDPSASPMLSHGRLDEVFTTLEVDEMLKKDDITPLLPPDLEKPRVTFLQCVGSRDRAHGRGHCSQFCCKTTIRQTRRLLHARPDALITVRYIDLQVMGKEFRLFHEKMKGKVQFVQGVPDQVDRGWDENAERIVLRSKDPETGEAVQSIADRVVLSVGIGASDSTRSLAAMLGVDLDDGGFVRVEPDGSGRTGRPGIWAVGAASGPTDIAGSLLQSLALAASVCRELGTTRQSATTSAQE